MYGARTQGSNPCLSAIFDLRFRILDFRFIGIRIRGRDFRFGGIRKRRERDFRFFGIRKKRF